MNLNSSLLNLTNKVMITETGVLDAYLRCPSQFFYVEGKLLNKKISRKWREIIFRHHRQLSPDELKSRQKEMKDYLVSEHPEVGDMSSQEFFRYMKSYFASEELEKRRKLAEHLEVFSDAVIAIIITIMVLELPLPSTQGGFGRFLAAVVIFLISFIVVANFWMMHHDIYSRVKTGVTEKVVVMDFIFMAELSLIPVLTKWMMVNHSNIPVMLYGGVYMLSTVTLTLISMYLNRSQFRAYPLMAKRYHKFDLLRLAFIIPINIVYIVLAYWFPREIFLFYIILPVFSFVSRLFNDDDTHWIEQQLEKENQSVETSDIANQLVDKISDQVESSLDEALENAIGDKISDQIDEALDEALSDKMDDYLEQKDNPKSFDTEN